MQNIYSRLIAKAKRMKLVDTNVLYAEHEILHLKRLLKALEIDLVIDIGANAGQYATRLRQLVGYKGEIVSVEPIPEMVKWLKQASKNDPKWHIEPLAISDCSGEVTFNVMSDLQCSSMLEPDSTETQLFTTQTTVSRTIKVNAETLDQLADRWLADGKFKRPFVKLDTQGRDVAILKGCKSVERFAAFQSELSVKRLYKDTPSFTEALTEYCSLGYDISAFVPNNGFGFPRLIEIDCFMVRCDLADAAQRN